MGHRGHAHSDDRNAKPVLIERRPAILDAGAWRNARIGQLHRPADPAQVGGSQSIHHNHAVRPGPVHHAAYHLGTFQPRQAQHIGRNGRHGTVSTKQRRHPLHQMAGHHQLPDHLGADGIRRHRLISQTRHQHRLAFFQRQQRPQLSGQYLGRPPQAVPLLLSIVHQVQGHIRSYRFSQLLFSLFIENLYRVHDHAFLFRLPGQNAAQFCCMGRVLFPQFLGFQGQVRPYLVPIHPKIHLHAPSFRPAKTAYTIIQNFSHFPIDFYKDSRYNMFLHETILMNETLLEEV